MPLDQFHDDERRSISTPDIVDRHDVGMVESGGSLGFPQHPVPALAAELGMGEQLDSDRPVKNGVIGPVNDTHTPLPNRFGKPVAILKDFTNHPVILA
jgi:hypothetical protein